MHHPNGQHGGEHPEEVTSTSASTPSSNATGRERPNDKRSQPEEASRQPEFHEPAPVPTAFGATTVGGAVAAAALASEGSVGERDPRDVAANQDGDGAVENRGDETKPSGQNGGDETKLSGHGEPPTR